MTRPLSDAMRNALLYAKLHEPLIGSPGPYRLSVYVSGVTRRALQARGLCKGHDLTEEGLRVRAELIEGPKP